MKDREKLYDLKNRRKTLIDEAKALALEGKLEDEDYKAKMADIERLSIQIKAVEDLLAQDEGANEPGATETALKTTAMAKAEEDSRANAMKAFAAAARKGFKVDKAAGDMMSEGVDADGGYTVPEDIVNDIVTLREAKESLLNEVRVVPVATRSGKRTFKKRSQHSGFATVAEAAKMGKTATPQFTTISYEIEKRRGYLPVTNELLEDSDANIVAIATEWLGDEARVTANNEILAVINAKAATDLTNLDGILTAWVGLGSTFRASSKLITNDDGLLWLGLLKDANGRQLLTPNPADPHQLQLVVGPHVLPVKTYDNSTIPTVDGKIPMILGDLKEGVVYWDRRAFSLKLNDSGVVGDLNALEQDLTLWVGSMRDDCTGWDDEAFINGYIATGTGTAKAAAKKS